MNFIEIIDFVNDRASHIGLLILLISALLYGIVNALHLINEIVGISVICAFLSAIAIYLICIRVTVEKSFLFIKRLNDSTKNVIIPLTKQSELYTELENKVVHANRRVYLMHLDSKPPTSSTYNDNNRIKYFKNCLAKAEEGRVKFRRIVNIENQEMLDWVENLINATDDLQNYQIAYIKTGDKGIENNFPFTITSCQIIDDDKMFLLNPVQNYVPRGEFLDCAYIENTEIVTVYAEYYNKLWIHLNDTECKYGFMIKDGPGTRLFKENKQKIIDNFVKNSDDKSTVHNIKMLTHVKLGSNRVVRDTKPIISQIHKHCRQKPIFIKYKKN